ncbi:MAG: DNA alkylation repair protein, partial [Anaerolineales bacterium]
RACLNLLESYADHTRRRGVWHPDEDVPWVLGVPRTVLRALANALAREVEGRSESALRAAGELWASGIREAQSLAAALVQTVPGGDAADWAQARVEDARDERAIETLAGPALAGWRRQDPAAFLGRIDGWLAGESSRWRTLGFRAIEAALEDPSFEPRPVAFDLLGGRSLEPPGVEGQAMLAAWRSAIARSPAEAAQTLLEELAAGGEPARRLISRNLEAFPERQRARLERALSGPPPPGIISPQE